MVLTDPLEPFHELREAIGYLYERTLSTPRSFQQDEATTAASDRAPCPQRNNRVRDRPQDVALDDRVERAGRRTFRSSMDEPDREVGSRRLVLGPCQHPL